MQARRPVFDHFAYRIEGTKNDNSISRACRSQGGLQGVLRLGKGLAKFLGRLGLPFRAGEVILSGSQSPLLPVTGGDELGCTIGGLGTCRARFHGKASVT